MTVEETVELVTGKDVNATIHEFLHFSRIGSSAAHRRKAHIDYKRVAFLQWEYLRTAVTDVRYGGGSGVCLEALR